MALSYTGPRSPHADIFAIEAFLTALEDDELAIKVRELNPKTLDQAFKDAQRLESYKGGQRFARTNEDRRGKYRQDHHQVRAATGPQKKEVKGHMHHFDKCLFYA